MTHSGPAVPRLDRCQHGRVALANLYTVHGGEDRFCLGDAETIQALAARYGDAPRRGTKKEWELRSWSGLPDPTTIVDCECGFTCDWHGLLAEASTEGMVLRCPACVAAGHPPAVRDVWVSMCPAFLTQDADKSTLVGSSWVTLLPLALREMGFDGRFLPAGVDVGYALARKATLPVRGEIPANSSLRLVELTFSNHPSGGYVFVFEVLDGSMAGTRFNIEQFERDVAWQQGFLEVSRAISMVVPPGAAEATHRRFAEARLRTVEAALEAFRRMALDHWDPSTSIHADLMNPIEPAEAGEPPALGSPEAISK